MPLVVKINYIYNLIARLIVWNCSKQMKVQGKTKQQQL